MFNYIWPVGLVVIANVLYQISTKSVPSDMDPFASLVITYLVAAALSIVMYFMLNKGGNVLSEMGKANFAPFLLGMSVVLLEVGFIYAYKAGWQISTLTIVQSSFLAVALIFVGFLLYSEAITWNKLLGIAVCLVGLVFVNMK